MTLRWVTRPYYFGGDEISSLILRLFSSRLAGSKSPCVILRRCEPSRVHLPRCLYLVYTRISNFSEQSKTNSNLLLLLCIHLSKLSTKRKNRIDGSGNHRDWSRQWTTPPLLHILRSIGNLRSECAGTSRKNSALTGFGHHTFLVPELHWLPVMPDMEGARAGYPENVSSFADYSRVREENPDSCLPSENRGISVGEKLIRGRAIAAGARSGHCFRLCSLKIPHSPSRQDWHRQLPYRVGGCEWPGWIAIIRAFFSNPVRGSLLTQIISRSPLK